MSDSTERPVPKLKVEADSSVAWEVNEALREAIAEFEKLLRTWADTKSQPLAVYHFTDTAALVGILSQKRLWATLATATNDASETRYAVETFQDLVTSGEILTANMDPDYLVKVSRRTRRLPDFKAYVCSFCGGAEAAHWLHYGRLGTGVAIGFDSQSLWQVGRFMLHQVLYEREEQRALMAAAVEIADRFAGKFQEQTRVNFYHLAIAFVLLVAPRIKSPAFRGEDEWRLIGIETKGRETPAGDDLPTTCFRTANNRVVPYKEISFSSLPLRHIELGSACPMRDDEQALRVLIDEKHGGPVNVTRSDVLVRP